MTLSGYCSNIDLARYLDMGIYKTYTISSYDSTVTYTLSPLTSSDGTRWNLISGGFTITDDGVTFASTKYTVDLNSGLITFTPATQPVNGSVVIVTYWLNEGFTDDDLTYFVELGAVKLEEDTRQVFREISVTNYKTDGNRDYTYLYPDYRYRYDINSTVTTDDIIQQNSNSVLYLDYGPILSVSALTVDGTAVTVSTLKLLGNKIMLTEDSEVHYFSGDHDSVTISFKYGITSTVLDRTEEDLRLLQLAKHGNILASFLQISSIPKGRNVLLDNTYVMQRSDGSVRPEMALDGWMVQVNKSYDIILRKLRMNGLSTI